MPALSIGVPVFNAEDHLRPTLECLVKQTFGDFEIIVSDNASTDRTVEIVRNFAQDDPRIRMIQQPENMGALFNFTHVLEQARGEYFMWRAYDDVTDDNYLEVLVRGLAENPDAALSAPAVERRRLDGSTSARMEFPDVASMGRIARVRTLLKTVSAGWMYGIYRREELLSVFERIITAYPHPWAQDHLIILHFLLNDRIVGANETTFFQLETGKSAEAYRPKTKSGQWAMAWDFLSTAFSELSHSRLTLSQKMALAPVVFGYTDGKTDKYRRLLRRLVKLNEDLLSVTIFDKIAAMKRDERAQAFECALRVHSDEGVFIGSLVPIGPWVLSHPDIIESLMRWRERYMRFFLTQFQVSIDKTTAFVKNVPIAKDDRLLFLIYDETEALKGHIGIADAREGHCELDNLIRGERGGHNQLIYFSEQTALDWAYSVLDVETVGLEVLSYNAPTIKLHSRFGFELTEAKPMHQSETEDVLTLAYCTAEEANVDFTCNAMTLSRQHFREQFGPSLFES